MGEYYVVLGDVVQSREIEDRKGFQGRLEETCSRFTARQRDDIYGDFKILKGIDEFGGVLQSLEHLYEVVTTFQDALLPHEVRLVVSSGPIDVALSSFDIDRMDGEAFHRASERLIELEDSPLSFDLLIDGEQVGRAIADEINLLLHRRRKWTKRQREVIKVRNEVETQMAAAKRLDVTQQAVSNVLADADWEFVRTVERRLQETLDEYAELQRAMEESSTHGTTGTAELPPTKRSITSKVVLSAYEQALDKNPADITAYFNYADTAIAFSRYDDALVPFSRVLSTTIDFGYSSELLDSIHKRINDVLEPVFENTTDTESVEEVLSLLAKLSERTTSDASEDVRLWSYVAFARWTGTPYDEASSNADDSETRALSGYCAGLGFLLAEEPETAVQYFRRAWNERDRLSGMERSYALAAGAGLLGCSDVLGSSILDDERSAVFLEVVAEYETLRPSVRRFLEGGSSEMILETDAETESDDLEQFSRVEAEAFATLRDLAN